MQFDVNKLSAWTQTVHHSLPGLLNLIGTAQGRGIILGAAVLQIYHDQRWIPRARATGDLDLSIGIISDAGEYRVLRESLIASGYTAPDPERYFRLFSPVKVGLAMAYLDLLAHPEGKGISSREARNTMGVGDSWSFDEIHFAMEQAHAISKNLFIPNPIGFLAMKAASYSDDPVRTKDLVDIVDVVFGLVGNGLHFDIGETWLAMAEAHPTVAAKVKSMISGIAHGAINWDFSRAEQEFVQRGYDFDRIEDEASRIFADFNDQLQ